MAFVRVPPDSTGKKVHTVEHTIGSDVVQTQAVHISSESNPSNLLEVDARGSAAVRFAEGQPILSGFGNLKTSTQRALGVYESSIDSYDELFSIIENNGGLSTYSSLSSSTILSTTTTSGSHASRTTNRYHYYLPGTSNVIVQTIACGDTGKIGNSRRWGAFDDNDGVFFELQGTTLNVVLRSSTSGSIVETRIPQSSFNRDNIDGLGVSGYNIDITKVNIYWIDYQWLGAGRVRFGVFEPSGSRLVIHEIENAGANPIPYMRTGTLPLRTENINTASTGSTSELREVCMAAYTEGEYADYTFWRGADVEVYDIATTSVDTHVISIQSKTTIAGHHNSIQCYPETLNIYVTAPTQLTIWQNTTLSGASWVSGISSVDTSTVGSLSTTNARKFQTFFFDTGGHQIDLTRLFEVNDEGIMCAANGIPEIWSLTAKRLKATNSEVSINLCYRELW